MLEHLLARVYALETKADDLVKKGHLLRAAEYYSRAAEAARELGEDNFASSILQAQQASATCSYVIYATAKQASEPHDLAPHRASCIALLSSSATAMERRRAAGTLLEGKCTAAEEAWYAIHLRRRNDPDLHYAASHAVLVGYQHHLSVAANALMMLSNAFVFEHDCSYEQFHAFAQHVVHAAHLLQLPRSHGDEKFKAEVHFVKAFRASVSRFPTCRLDARLVHLLMQTWERLQRSGVMQSELIELGIDRQLSEERAQLAAIAKSATAPGLRSCALASCGAKEAHPDHFKSCAACRAVAYCCREHQVADWPSHKAACKAARKAGAAKDKAPRPSGA